MCATSTVRVEAEGGKRKNEKSYKGEKEEQGKEKQGRRYKKEKKCRISLHFVLGVSPGRQASK